MAEVWDGVLLIATRVVAPVSGMLFLVIMVVYAVGRLMDCLRPAELPVLVVFCLLGAVVGLFTGNSRSPVVAGLLPAIVTFASALVAYIASKDTMKTWRRQVPLHLIGFLVTIGLTAFYGAYLRGLAEKAELQAKRDLLFYEKVQLEVEKEKLLLLIRPAAEAPTKTAAPAPKPGG